MNWENARRLLRSAGRREATRAPQDASRPPFGALAAPRAGSLCIASGKGGTGKSVLTASLGSWFSRGQRTLVVDADMGVGNAHILHDIQPALTFVDVVENDAPMSQVVQRVRPNLDLVAAGSGVSHMAGLTSFDMHLVACGLEAIETNYDVVLLDSAAGISNQTVAFAAACDACVIVTTPDVTALTDAYAFLKVFVRRAPTITPMLVVNRVPCLEEGRKVAERMARVAQTYIGRAPRHIGCLPYDEGVVRSVNARMPTLDYEPQGEFARAFCEVAANLRAELERTPHAGLGRSLLRSVGYTPQRG